MSKLKTKPDGLGHGKTYLGKVAVTAAAPEPGLVRPEDIDAGKVLVKLYPREIRFLEAYVTKGTGVQAMLSLFPKLKYMTAHRKARRWMVEIDAKISAEEKYALMGLTPGVLIGATLRALGAKYRKEFVTREGKIVAGADHEDHQAQMDGVKTGMKLLGLDKESNNPTISINVINYAPPGSTPWPTSGAVNPEIDITPGGEEI